MKLTIDPKHNIAYLRFHEKTAQVQTLRISDELNIDLSPDGTIYGIKLLNANEQMLSEDQGKALVVTSAGTATVRGNITLPLHRPPLAS